MLVANPTAMGGGAREGTTAAVRMVTGGLGNAKTTFHTWALSGGGGVGGGGGVWDNVAHAP